MSVPYCVGGVVLSSNNNGMYTQLRGSSVGLLTYVAPYAVLPAVGTSNCLESPMDAIRTVQYKLQTVYCTYVHL